MKKITTILFLLVLLFPSCGNFLNEYSQDLVYARNCSDLNEILVGQGYMSRDANDVTIDYKGTGQSHYHPYLHIMSDDAQEVLYGYLILNAASSTSVYKFRNLYTWQQYPFTTIEGNNISDVDWSKIYKHISTANVVLNYVDNFKDDPIELQNKVKGEACFLRGAYYLLLVNMYANPYNAVTAKTDMGVPIKISQKVEDRYFVRNSVQEVYEQIIKDLEAASNYLKGVVQPSYFHATERAARVLLSRVYLYMGDWENAIKQADMAIALNCPLRDLNREDLNAMGVNKVCMNQASCETVFTMGTPTVQALSITSAPTAFFGVSDELYNAYIVDDTIEDLRRKCFFIKGRWTGYITCSKSPFISNTSRPTDAFETYIIRTVEVYLNKAEALAMNGRDAEAIAILKKIYDNRFLSTGKQPSIDGLAGEDLVTRIREERRLELCFESGHRWFDLRRYAVSPKYPERKELVHKIYAPVGDAQLGTLVGSYTLKPYGQDKAWLLPIPQSELIFNNQEGEIFFDNPKRDNRPNNLIIDEKR